MKNILFLLILMTSGVLFIQFFSAATVVIPPQEVKLPDSVKRIIDRSCYECHNSNAKNRRAKKNFNFDELNSLKTYQVVGKWVNVADLVINNEMPPRKYLKKHPEKTLTYNETLVLTNWVDQLTEQPRQAQVTLDNQLEELNRRIVNGLDLHNKSRVAVLDFFDTLGNINNLGRYISEELITRLYFVGEKEVFNKQSALDIIKNSNLSVTGSIDDSVAMEIGRLLGVDGVVYGILRNEESVINIDTRLLSADSGNVLTVASIDIPKEEKVTALFLQNVTAISEVFAKSKGPKPVPTKPEETPTVEKGGFVFELLDAQVKDSAIVCFLKITNPGENHKDFQMRAWFKEEGNTVVFDDSGNAYYISAAKFGSKMVKEMFNVHKTTKTIYAGTSLDLEIYFNNEKVSPKSTKKISTLKIISEIDPWYTVEFLNIPLK